MKMHTIAPLLALATTAAWADTKVSDRVALSSGDLAPATDILPIVDVSAGTAGSKKITINNLFAGWGAVALTATQTLTNKTLTAPIVNLGSDATGDLYYRHSSGSLARLGVGTNGHVLTLASGLPSWAAPSGGSGSGDVVGPASATDNAIARWDTTTGKLVQNSTVTVSDTGVAAGLTLGSGTAIALGSDATGDLHYRDASGNFVRLGIGSTGQVLTVASGLPSWAAAGGGGLTNWTDALNSSSPNATVTVASLTATGAATNIDAVLKPKGTGAVLAHIPDSTSTGGSKRGASAVDLQTIRTTSGQVASGSYATIAGGSGNSSLGTGTAIIGGLGNTSNGPWSASLGGRENTAGGDYSVTLGGYQATTRSTIGVLARASGAFSTVGDCQTGGYILRVSTASATQTQLTTDGQSASSNRIVLPDNHAYKFRGQAVARSSTGDVKTWDITGTIKRGSGAGTTAIVGTVTVTVKDADTGASAWSLDLDADTTAGGLRVRGTGAASTTIHWGCSIETFEVS